MTRALTDEEYEAIRDGFRRIRDAAAFIMSAKTDLFLTELLTLKVGDIRHQSGSTKETIQFRRCDRWGGKVITVAFDAEIRLVLEALSQEIVDRGGGPDSYLFCGRNLDKPLSPQRLYLIMRLALADLGRDVRCQSLRLSVGSRIRKKARRRKSPVPKGFLKRSDVKRIYGVSDTQLRRWARLEWLPRLRAGVGRGLLVYRPEDIERIKCGLKGLDKDNVEN